MVHSQLSKAILLKSTIEFKVTEVKFHVDMQFVLLYIPPFCAQDTKNPIHLFMFMFPGHTAGLTWQFPAEHMIQPDPTYKSIRKGC